MANAFTVSGTAVSASSPGDLTLCRVSGSARSILGTAVSGTVLKVRHIYSPLLIATDTLVLREEQTVRAAASGVFSFDLIRGATVRIELLNRPDLDFEVVVPDAASINIADLILPYIASVAFDDVSPLEVSVGQVFTLNSTGTLSNGGTIETTKGAELELANATILRANSAAQFTALTVGSTTVTMTSIDEDVLDLGEDPRGGTISRLDKPATALPAALTVSVS